MLRLCCGEFNGRKLHLPPQNITRPASQKVRQAIFNILQHRYNMIFDDALIFDLFAGSGAMGFEALSMGAKNVIFFEKSFQILPYLHKNIQALSVSSQTRVISQDLFKPFPKKYEISGPARLTFIDPPYIFFDKVTSILDYFHEKGWINNNTLICAEGPQDKELSSSTFHLDDRRTFGQTWVHFGYVNKNEKPKL